MTNVLDSLIVGAGISGLSLAHALQNRQNTQENPQIPIKILVAESQGRVGGNITTVSEGDFLWEEGPNSFSPAPELLKLAVDVGLKQDLVLADRKLPRYVYLQGELMPVPMSPPALLNSKLLSGRGKLRALVGALGFVRPPMGTHLSQQQGEETVAQFFERHLGDEVLYRLVQPFVSGVYAGDPQQLSAKAAFGRVAQMAEMGGGLLPGAVLARQKTPKSPLASDPTLPKIRPGELGSFRRGLGMLPKAIADQLPDQVKLNWHLNRLSRTPDQTYLAEFSTPEGPRSVEARTVTLTTPAYISAEILKSLHPTVTQHLEAISYPPVACVVLAYPKSALKYNMVGFGNLIPRGQGIRTLGTIWTSSLFPGRAPQEWQMLTNYIGGATDPEIGNLEDYQIVDAVHQDLRRVLLKDDVAPKVLAVHPWKRAIPQYNLGHLQRLEAVQNTLKTSLPGLYVSSNFIGGVALGDCIKRSQQQATEILSRLTVDG